jgi:predicted lactoylglutathione lyase
MFVKDFGKISLNTFIAYLKSLGWQVNNNFPNKKAIVLCKIIDDEEFSLLIPSRETFRDYDSRMNDAVNTVSVLENISADNLIKNVVKINDGLQILSTKPIEKEKQFDKLINKDRLSFRVISEATKNGTLPIDYAANIIEGMKKLIVSAIYSEKAPRKYFLTTGNQHNLGNYRLGQTEVGSYIFNLEIDITEDDEQLKYNVNDEIDVMPMSRKVIRRIQKGIAQIVDIQNNSEIEYLESEGYIKGLNANMCEALLNFNNKMSIKVETQVKWADNLEKPKNIPEKLSIETKDFYFMQDLAVKYKKSTMEKVAVSGYIYRLNNENKDDENSSERYVMIEAVVEKKYRKVKIPLGKVDYSVACEAHKKGKRIEAVGELDSSLKTLVLCNYEKFTVLE